MTTKDWNLDDQQAATRYSIAQLIADRNVPENAEITLELFFIPTDDADTDALLKSLKTFGYTADPEEENIEGGGTRTTVLVTVEKIAMTADNIWMHEERTTKIALTRGYTPDGWGFLEP